MAAQFYSRITNQDGTPVDRFFGHGTVLEKSEDVTAALRESYGMIWWLAEMLCAGYSGRGNVSREAILASIELAKINSDQGRSRGGSGN